MTALCHVCGNLAHNWNLSSAEFHVGKLQHFAASVCPQCSEVLEATVVGVLRSLGPTAPYRKISDGRFGVSGNVIMGEDK